MSAVNINENDWLLGATARKHETEERELVCAMRVW